MIESKNYEKKKEQIRKKKQQKISIIVNSSESEIESGSSKVQEKKCKDLDLQREESILERNENEDDSLEESDAESFNIDEIIQIGWKLSEEKYYFSEISKIIHQCFISPNRSTKGCSKQRISNK